MRPWSAISNPHKILRIVDLPQPEGPIKASVSLGQTLKSTPFRTSRSPNAFVSPLTSIIGCWEPCLLCWEDVISTGCVGERGDNVIEDENHRHGPDDGTCCRYADVLSAAACRQANCRGEHDDDGGIDKGFEKMHREVAVQNCLL